MKLIIGILAALALVIALAVSITLVSYSPVHASQGTKPPAKPTGLTTSAEPGSLDVSLDWDGVDGAIEYRIRWRLDKSGHRLNDGIRTGSSATTITLSEYGEWVVRVQACNDAGCGEPVAERFSVEQAPEPAFEPTPTPTPTTAPRQGTQPPGKPTGLSVSTAQGSLDVSLDWDDAGGATEYRVRWRLDKSGHKLNDGIRTGSSAKTITLTEYGEWVVRVQACNDAGCGEPVAERFSVEPAPEPSPTPTQITPNNPPVFDRNNIRVHTVLENYGPLITAGTYVVRDPENNRITVSLAGADAASFSTSLYPWNNQLIIDLELNATPNYESPADANGDGVYEVTIRAVDANGSGETTESDVTVTVLDVDEAPVITGPAAVSFAEHSGSDVGQYSAADPEGGTATLTLGGTDAASFTLAGGTLTFNAAPDYETRDSYSVTITASDGTNTATLDVTITITDVDETAVNLGPVVDAQAERYAGFTGTDNAPRGTLVSKVYDGIFSDPNGDTLTYTVSVPADRSELVDTVYVHEDTQRVFIRLDAEDDWGAVTPALPKPLVTTVTLTATDPDGLSASVTGEFQTGWEAAPAPALQSVCDRTSQVRDVLVKLLGKACGNIGANDLSKVNELDLSNTGLRSLRTEDFSGMSNLREVDASNNEFTSWTDACAATYGDTVQNVNLTNNKLGGTGSQIASGCFTATKFPNLVSLHLGATRINSLAGDPFDGLTNLEILDLSQNQITAVPVAVFEDLSNLWYLNLGRNALTKSGLPASVSGGVKTSVFDDLSSLEWLALNNQFEQDADNNFAPKTTAQLTELDVNVFTGLSSLKELDLANNGITSTGLPNNVFTPLSSLESLALFGNAGSPFTLTNKGVRAEASVTQFVTPPTGFTAEPVSGGVKLTWDDPSDTNISHEYRALTPDGTGSIGWTDISSPTDNGATLEKTVSTGLSSGTGYAFQLRSEKSGAHSYRADADCFAIFGTSGNDTLTGSGQVDCIIGLAGDDTLKGGGGADKLDGGAGTDTASYAGSAHGVIVDLSISTGQAAEGISPAGGDVLSNIENITGSGGNDTLTGDASANVINGGAGGDTMTGGAGTDTLSYASATSSVWVDIGSTPEIKLGDAAGDSASGFENLTGSPWSDILIGDANDNVIIGNGRADEMDGGAGTDTVSYAASDDSVAFNFAGGNFTNKDTGHLLPIRHGDRVGGGGHAEGNIISGFENVIGSAYPDWFIINAAGNKIDGGDSIDDGKSTIYFPKADIWNHNRSSEGINHLQEFYLDLGDVVDYRKSTGGVTVNLTTGTNRHGYAQGDTLTGIESIVGSHFGDRLTGDENNNTFFGLAGGDVFIGQGGIDVVDYSWGNPFTMDPPFNSKTTLMTLDLKTKANNTWHAAGDSFSGIEWFLGSLYKDKITGGDNNDRLSGGSGEDILRGGAGDDVLYGPDSLELRTGHFGQSYDQLYGEAGNDRIIVGNQDNSYGGAGNDKFLALASAHMDGGDGTDEYYFHRNYFPGPAWNAGAAQIWNYDDNENIRICMGSGQGDGMNDSDGEVSWTTSLNETAGDLNTNEVIVTVSLQVGTTAANQGTFLVVDYTDTSKVDIAWSDPNAAVGTGCNFVDLDSVPGQTRMIRKDIEKLIYK